MNCSHSNVRKWMRRLIKQKYVRIERERYGFRLFILNPKKVRVSKLGQSEAVQGVQTRSCRVSTDGQSKGIHSIEKSTTSEKLLRNNPTKLLKNNNTTPLADARSLPSLLRDLGKEKTVPSDRPSQEQLAGRENLLLDQRQQILNDPRFAKKEIAIPA
jgi:hypothetical protein